MNTLFLDTHDAEIVVALFKNEVCIDKCIKSSNRNHSDYTMPMIKDILDNNNITIHDLNEIIVVNGPGSFTGVRLGVTIAKTLAYTLNIPIKTINTLQMYALGSNTKDNKIVAINDVKGVFAGMFDSNSQQLTDLFYKSNEEFSNYIKNNNYENIIVQENIIDFNKIYEFMKNEQPINAHHVNPIYIKIIEALK